MDTIIPRWEWRTFGTDFGAAEATFAALEPELTQESDEVYLLSPRTDAAVKIRAGLMDVKKLKEVDDAGLAAVAPGYQGNVPAPPQRGQQSLLRSCA